MEDIIDYDIRKAVTDYMIMNGVSKREAIYKANEIIKKLAEECKRDENPCIDCGFWDFEHESCCCFAYEKWRVCPIENKKVKEYIESDTQAVTEKIKKLAEENTVDRKGV